MDIVAGVLLVIWIVLIALGLPGLVTIRQLRPPRNSMDPLAGESVDETLPRISIIVAARNEERGIGEGLRSLLRLEYPAMEIIAVNDRSTDRTGEIMREVEQEVAQAGASSGGNAPQLRVIDITDLPRGWLGKNHALYHGSQHATGEWLLFTDADIVFNPQALTIAVKHALHYKLDHLALTPNMRINSLLLRALVMFFMFNLMLFFMPQYARFSWSPAHMGVGAFNLIRKQVYEAIGTHEVIRMRPDDDLRLGRQVKLHGFRQDFAIADQLLSVEWYASVGEMIRGLEKNSLAPFEYRIWFLVGGLIPLLAFYLLPFIGPLISWGLAHTLFSINFVLCLVYFTMHGKFYPMWFVYFLLWPVTVPIFLYAIGRAAILTWLRGGIEWRDTRYSLAELKQK
ncbi:glycosyltransferase [Brevibacillus dissolubilis]|uniref:glycosyltransferase n=1 Tax=Brevibacillus dissolubilis TaxID=1844116 RepID=UPI00159B943D|nr:glycosyltransferase family 2 protein [Brevibacillus dissolubilis]